MTQRPATRKYSDDEYGSPGYWYYYWPALKCVFRTDYPAMKFNPADDTVELTLPEYLAVRVRIDRDRKIRAEFIKNSHPVFYFYWDGRENIAFKTDEPVTDLAVIELYESEYIDLSIRLGQNEEDTLL